MTMANPPALPLYRVALGRRRFSLPLMEGGGFKAASLWRARTQKEPLRQRGRTPGRRKFDVSPNSQPLWLRALYITPLFHRYRWQRAWKIAQQY